MSAIEWTDKTWNPLKGCLRLSPGCLHCYAERQAARPILSGPGKPYEGLVTFGKQGPRWTGKSAGPDGLDAPLRWRKPARIFPCSMSDLFFEGHSDEAIAAVFGVMAACPQHTFQVLTKRPARALQWLRWLRESTAPGWANPSATCRYFARHALDGGAFDTDPGWPLPNVWIGTSVESQRYAEERLPLLVQIPAALLWVSCEPLLEAVDLTPWLPAVPDPNGSALGWVVVGGESGPGARPLDLAWPRSLRDQCAAASVPYFFKQAGARPVFSGITRPGEDMPCRLRDAHGHFEVLLNDKKGGDLTEIPADLRVREFPEVRRG